MIYRLAMGKEVDEERGSWLVNLNSLKTNAVSESTLPLYRVKIAAKILYNEHRVLYRAHRAVNIVDAGETRVEMVTTI